MPKADSRHQIARHITQYFFSTVLAQVVGLARSIIIPVIFSPVQLGVWNLMNVVIGYGGHAHFGLLHGMNKMIPLLNGQGIIEKAKETRDTIFWMNMLFGAFAGSALLIVSLTVFTEYAVYLQIVAAIVFLQQIFNYFSSLLRAEHTFGIASKGVALFSILSAVLVVGGAFAFTNRLLGALIGLLAAFGYASVYWFRKTGYSFAFRLNPSVIRESLTVGLPLVIIGFLDAIFLSIDRWIITKYLSMGTLGYYSIAVMASSLLATVPNSASSVLYPRMLERFAANPKPKTIKGLLIGPLRATSAVMIILVSVATIGLPLLIRLFLPKYLASVPIIEILIPSSFFLSITSFSGFYLTSVNKQSLQIAVLIVASVLSGILDYILLRSGYGVIGITLGTAAGYLVYGVGYALLALYLATGKKSEAVRFVVRLAIPFFVMVLVMAATGGFIREDAKQAGHIMSAVWRMAVVIGALLPALWFVNRDGEVLAMVRIGLQSLLARRRVVHKSD